jgi:gamma-glutamyltranspeptidase/glutathione hydrolase
LPELLSDPAGHRPGFSPCFKSQDGSVKRFLVFLILGCLLWQSALAQYLQGNAGMVSSRSAPASEVGADILRKGGNAVDAAVATAFALAVTYPSAGNIGGGGFVVMSLPDGQVLTQDNRETAPAAASETMFLDAEGNVDRQLASSSLQASGVPGTVAGLLDLLERHGTMSRQDVMAPAIRIATEGLVLNDDLANQFSSNIRSFREHPATLAKFTRDGVPYASGDVWKQPDLARTLQRISDEGRDGFYKGETADMIVAEMQANNGLITHEDLENYEVVWREPVHGTYRGFDIWSMPPPSSGGVMLIEMLNMMEPFDLKAMGFGSVDALHLMIEAQRRAYADRAEYLGDPAFVDVPVSVLTSKEYALQRFSDFDPQQASDSNAIGVGNWPYESPDTTHLSVIDSDGMAVAMTTTLNATYGNRWVIPGTGILMNNEMPDFATKPSPPHPDSMTGAVANAIEPGKRMMSSMSPTIIKKDGEVMLVTGSPGGSTIINTVLQVIINVLDHGMGIEAAVMSPRIHHQWQPDNIRAEPGAMSEEVQAKLSAMGHANISVSNSQGDANSIMVRDGVIEGMADLREAGGVAGF